MGAAESDTSSGGWRVACRRLACLAALLVPVLCAFGQGFSTIEPPVTAADLRVFVSTLELSDDQRVAAEALHDGFLESLRQRTAPFRELELKQREATAAHAENAPSLTEQYEPALREFFLARASLRAAFVRDLKATLTARQLDELWPAAERAVRRRSVQRMGRVGMSAWSKFNLEEVATSLKLEQSDGASVEPVLKAWATEIDVPLLAREKLWAEYQLLPLQQQRDKAEECYARDQALSRQTATINRKYTRQLVSALPESAAARLTARVNELVYPLFAEPRPGKETLARAAALDDLLPDQKTELEGIRTRYERDSKALDIVVISRSDGVESEWERYDERPIEERDALAREGKDLLGVIYSELATDRIALETRTNAAVLELLSAEQRKRLSHPPP